MVTAAMTERPIPKGRSFEQDWHGLLRDDESERRNCQ
jgi:hypothetical protein